MSQAANRNKDATGGIASTISNIPVFNKKPKKERKKHMKTNIAWNIIGPIAACLTTALIVVVPFMMRDTQQVAPPLTNDYEQVADNSYTENHDRAAGPSIPGNDGYIPLPLPVAPPNHGELTWNEHEIATYSPPLVGTPPGRGLPSQTFVYNLDDNHGILPELNYDLTGTVIYLHDGTIMRIVFSNWPLTRNPIGADDTVFVSFDISKAALDLYDPAPAVRVSDDTSMPQGLPGAPPLVEDSDSDAPSMPQGLPGAPPLVDDSDDTSMPQGLPGAPPLVEDNDAPLYTISIIEDIPVTLWARTSEGFRDESAHILLSARFELGELSYHVTYSGSVEMVSHDEFIVMLSAVVLHGEPDLEFLADPVIPELRFDLLTLDEALSDPDFGALLPQNIPSGMEFGTGARIVNPDTNSLSADWSKPWESSLSWSISEATDFDMARVISPEDRHKYDISLYTIPWMDSVPPEYINYLNDPLFLLEDITRDVLQARVDESRMVRGLRMNFGVLVGDIVIRISTDGLTVDKILDMLPAM